RAGTLGISAEIDGDIHAELLDRVMDLPVGYARGVDEPIERAHEPGAHLAAVVVSEGDGRDLEARAIVPLEQLDGEMRHGMVVEVGAEIGNLDSLRSGGPSFLCPATGSALLVRDERADAVALRACVIGRGQERERRHDRAPMRHAMVYGFGQSL